MAVVDPKSKEYDKRPRFNPRSGKAVVQVVGMQGGESNGKPYWSVGVVVLRDMKDPDPSLDPPTDVGLMARIRLYRTPQALWRLVGLARTLGRTDPFDVDEIGDKLDADGKVEVRGTLSVLAGVPFVATIETREVEPTDGGKKRTYSDVEEWEPFVGTPDPEWAGILDGGFDKWEEGLAKAAEYAAKNPRRGGSGGGQRGGGSSSGGGGGGRREADDGIPFIDDDVMTLLRGPLHAYQLE